MKGQFNNLNEDAPLFKVLRNGNAQQPTWWKKLVNDDRIYIEIRKDNYINVYYRGGNVAKIEWKKDQILATCHQKYLGDNTPKTTIGKDGKIKNNYEYRKCNEWLEKRFDELLRNIEDNYSNKKSTSNKIDENSSEKFIQGFLITSNRSCYLDSEFAYNDKELPDLRIDLVKCNNEGEITFVELKRIADNRLRTLDNNPEIITQMTTYKKFIDKYYKQFVSYYQKVYNIKTNIGIRTIPTCPQSINLMPHLLIVNNYSKTSTKKEKRIKDIQNTIQTIPGISSKIEKL